MGDVLFSDTDLALLAQGATGIPGSSIEDVERFADPEKPVFLFGCGGFGRWTAWTIDNHGGGVAGFFDNNPATWGEVTAWHRTYPVYDPQTAPAILEKTPGATLLLAVSAADAQVEIQEQCQRLGVELSTFSLDWIDPEAANNPDAARAYSLFADDQSRELYRFLVRKRSGLEPRTEMPGEGKQYFVDFLPRGAFRSFLDVGALDGDTFRRFLELFGDDYDNYYAVEPNPRSARAFHPGPEACPKLRLFTLAASDAAGTALLTDSHSISSMLWNSGVEVKTDTLDHMLAGLPVTFLKMDVEGWEMEALRGAAGIIREQRPVLALSVYHRLRHFWEIPLLVRELWPGYRLYLRHHSRYLTETICYAAP